MAGLPTGTVTFLFTDLEASSRLWEDHPEAMKAALARHDAILNDAVAAHGGQRVKGRGDGVHAVFDLPADAVRAAGEAQARLGSEAWPVTGPLRVRMAVHSGVAEVREGDYFGPAVNRAARLMALAHGGQVLVSLATEELVRDALPDTLGLLELGEHRLRDVSRPERVFQLTGPGLKGEFPPLRSVGSSAGNVTLPATSFVGRDEELARVAALVAEGPLVTLLGVGGVGKTRLALQFASDTAGRFDDGAWFCDLAAVSDDDDVALSVAGSLAVVPRSGLSPTAALVEFLRPKQMLLVLDNCEHVIDGVAGFAEQAMGKCRRLRLLATSREALAVEGERLCPIKPLRVLDPSAGLEAAASSPSVQLFVDRVRMLRPEFSLDRSNLESVLEVCQHLDGIPLALELAAARMTSMSPREIADRLDHRFSLLAGGRRRAVARHETLRAAVDWSYELLEDPEQAVLSWVSVFSGGFTLEAAERVTAGADIDVLNVLARLVDKSLVTLDDVGGETRYRLFETIREYALEQLDNRGDTAATRDRHLAYCVDFAERAAAGMRGPDQQLWEPRTAAEAENLRSAVAWAITTANAGAALRLVAAPAGMAGTTWTLRGVTADLARAALDVPGAARQPHYALALTAAADYAVSRGYYADAVELAEEALRHATERDSARWNAEMVLGRSALFDARDDPAVHFERALETARRTGEKYVQAVAQANLAAGLSFHGADDLDRARAEAEAAVQLAEETGSPSAIALANFGLGYILVLCRDPDAVEPLRRSLTAGATSVESPTNPGSLSMLAIHYARHGTPAQALDALEGAINDVAFRADPSYTSSSLDLALPVLLRYGDATTAAEILGAIQHGKIPGVTRAGVAEQRRTAGIARLDNQLTTQERRDAEARGAAMTHDEIIAHTLERIAALRTELAHRVANNQ